MSCLLTREEGGGRTACGSKEAAYVFRHQFVDLQAQADYALVVAVEALLEPEVIDLMLQAHVLEVPVLVLEHAVRALIGWLQRVWCCR